MKKNQIQRFIRKATGGFDIRVALTDDDGCGRYELCAYGVDNGAKEWMIAITRSWWKEIGQIDPQYQRAILLHEIGHFLSCRHRLAHVREFRAQKWAIERAVKLGWSKIASRLLSQLDAWADDDLSPGRRRYTKAGRLARRNGYIPT